MKRALIANLVFLVGGCWSLVFSQVANRSTIFLINNPQKSQWCSYTDEKRWRSGIDNYGAIETASAEFDGSSVKTVKLTEADNPESGDWIAYDTYTFDSLGAVTSLHRITKVLPGDVSRDELFTNKQGKLQRTKVILTSLKTRHAAPFRKLWYPDRKIVSRASALSFYSLLRNDASVRPPSCIDLK